MLYYYSNRAIGYPAVIYHALSVVKCELSMPLRTRIVYNQMPICERRTMHSDVCCSTFTHLWRSAFYNCWTTTAYGTRCPLNCDNTTVAGKFKRL